MKKKISLITVAIIIIAMSSVAQQTGTFTDSRDGKTYKTVKIGTQTWMAENLSYKAMSECWAYDNKLINVAKYGYLYSWKSAKGACPSGWHLPSDAEWTALITYLGGEFLAGKKLKSTSGWDNEEDGNGNGTNTSRFSALPGGGRVSEGKFVEVGNDGGWWSSAEFDTATAWQWNLIYDEEEAFRNKEDKQTGFSVRCLRNK
ncbi:MAG: fibrobacter succinogenes major paralogous domain-containing protein [Bacteroidota bacterium]